MSIKLPPPRPQPIDTPPPPLRDPGMKRRKPKKEKLRVRLRNRYRQDPAGTLFKTALLLCAALFFLTETGYLYRPALGRGDHRLIFALQPPFLFRYDLHAPQAQQRDTTYPLVIIMRDMKDPPYAARKLVRDTPLYYPAFVMIPRIPPHTPWAMPDDPRFETKGLLFPEAYPVVLTMIGIVTASYPIDPARIYLVGDKDGARGVYALASTFPDSFAAALTTAGSWPPEDIAIGATKLRVYNGAQDNVAPPGLADALTRSARLQGGDATFHLVEDTGHDLGRTLYREDGLWRWLFAQSRR